MQLERALGRVTVDGALLKELCEAGNELAELPTNDRAIEAAVDRWEAALLSVARSAR